MIYLSDFNNNIKIIVTVIEKSKAESFVLNSVDCPFNCHIEEFSAVLKDVMFDANYEEMVEYYRKSQRN